MVNAGVFVPYLRGKAFNFSPWNMMLAVGLSYMTFIILRYIPSVPNMLSFCHEKVLNFVKCFFASVEMTILFLSLILLIWCITFIDLHILNHFYIPGINPTCFTSACFGPFLFLVFELLIKSNFSYTPVLI